MFIYITFYSDYQQITAIQNLHPDIKKITRTEFMSAIKL